MHKKILSVIPVIFFLITNVYSQAPAIQWQACFGGAGQEESHCIQQTADGGYITCGSTYLASSGTGEDIRVVKIDISGAETWEKTIGSTAAQDANYIQQTSDGGYIVAGLNKDQFGNIDYWILKLNSVGDIIWQKTFGGSFGDQAHSIQQTNDGGYIVLGDSYSSDGDITGSHGDLDYWVLKLDNLGNIVWQKPLGGSASDNATCIKQTFDGGYIVSGYTRSVDGDVYNPGHILGIAWIVKLDATGNIEWQKVYGSNNGGENCVSICLAPDGGYAFTGTCYANSGDVTGNHGNVDFWVVRINAAGDLLWQKSLGGSSIDQPECIIPSADGGFVVAGWTASIDGDISAKHPGLDYWVVKLSSAGSLVWQKALGGDNAEMAYSIMQTSDLGYIITGYSDSNNSGDVGASYGMNDFWVVKLGPGLVPVTLSVFDAITKGQDVNCMWNTIQEQNSSHFVIERSDDATHFTSIGKVVAAGNSSVPLVYNFTDQNALASGKAYLYYRLKMVDLDGSFKYSNTVKVQLKYSPALSVYPSPVVDMLTVSFSSSINEQTTLSIFNDAGINVYQEAIAIIKGNNIKQIDTKPFPAGNYILVLNGQSKYAKRFIKLNR